MKFITRNNIKGLLQLTNYKNSYYISAHCVGGQAPLFTYITDLSQQAYGEGARMILSLQTG